MGWHERVVLAEREVVVAVAGKGLVAGVDVVEVGLGDAGDAGGGCLPGLLGSRSLPGWDVWFNGVGASVHGAWVNRAAPDEAILLASVEGLEGSAAGGGIGGSA